MTTVSPMSKPAPNAALSLLWSTLDTAGTVVVGIVSVLVVARLIGDRAFGLGAIALGTVLIPFVAIGSLVHDALVRKKELTIEDLDTAFAASLFASAMTVLFMGLLAPTIARLFGQQRLVILIWAFLPLVIFNGLSTPLMADRRRALDFRTVGQQQLTGRLIGMCAGLIAAVSGAGVWSMVVQHVSTAAYVAATMLLLAPRRPRIRLSWRRLAPMLRFSSPIIASQMLSQGTGRLFIFAIGYWHGLAAAGYWGVATRLTESLVGAATQATYNVALAYMVRMQGSRRRLTAALERAQGFLMIASIPVLAALAAAAEPLIRVLLGRGWAPTEYLLLGCLPGSFVVLRQILPVSALRAVGQSQVSIVATAATFVTASAGLLVAGSLAPVAVAVVCGLSPVSGYAVVTTMVNREFGRPVIREVLALLRDFGCGLLGFILGRSIAALPGDGTPLLQTPIAAIVGFVTALTMLALVQPKMVRRLLRHTRAVPPVPASSAFGLSTGASAPMGLVHRFVLRGRGS